MSECPGEPSTSSKPATTQRTLADVLRAQRSARNFCSNTIIDSLFLPPQNGPSDSQRPRSSVQPRTTKSGLPRGALLDIAGAPGEGKSRIALGYALGARIVPLFEDGKGKARAQADAEVEVLIIDTEGDLAPQVFYDAALIQCQGDVQLATQVCSGIHHARCTTTEEFVALLHCLGEWLDAHPRVQLVILDCLSTHLRTVHFPRLPPDANHKNASSSSVSSTAKRKRDSWGAASADADDDGPAVMRASVIAMVKQTLTDLTGMRNLGVIVTNQIATKHVNSSGVRVSPMASTNSVFDPQLGQLWQPPNTYRVMLMGDHDGSRLAMLYDTPFGHARASVRFAVDPGGIVNVE